MSIVVLRNELSHMLITELPVLNNYNSMNSLSLSYVPVKIFPNNVFASPVSHMYIINTRLMKILNIFRNECLLYCKQIKKLFYLINQTFKAIHTFHLVELVSIILKQLLCCHNSIRYLV